MPVNHLEQCLARGRLTWVGYEDDGGDDGGEEDEGGDSDGVDDDYPNSCGRLWQNTLDWVAYKHFLTVPEAGKSKIKVLADLVSAKSTSWCIEGHLLAVSSHGGRGKGSPLSLFYKGTNPI